MAKLSTFSFADLMDLRGKLRNVVGEEPPSFEEAAQRVVTLFRDELLDEEGKPACALVRVYKTHPFDLLPDDLKRFARTIEPDADAIPGLRCLVLMATAGDEPAWNSRQRSRSHKAIPLSSEKAVANAPMVAQLFQQLDISVAHVLRPDPGLLLDIMERSQNVFYVPVAEGSPFIVAQDDFVKPYGIQSVIGFGGMVASGDLIAAILFSKQPISAAVADHFKVVGLNFKLAMLPFIRKPLFAAATP